MGTHCFVYGWRGYPRFSEDLTEMVIIVLVVTDICQK